MEKTEHTPGPWIIETDSGMNIYITQPQDMPNRTPGFYAEVRRFTSSIEAVKANARLIAAAPELLEALELMLQRYGYDTCEHVQKSQAAIAKARGEA